MKSLFTVFINLGITLAWSSLSAQTTASSDSVSLSYIVNQVTGNYPTIKKNEQDISAADARIGLAKTAYYPDISLNSSYSHIGPVSSITFPGFGTFDLYPANNYSATINYNQTVYDFGKTEKIVAMESQNKALASLSTDQIKQRLSLSIVNIYYAIVYLQEAIKIKDEQLNTLTGHLRFVEKKKETGSATTYEVLTTKVRISTIENQKTDLQTSLKVQICQMNSLLGKPEKTSLTVKKELQPVVSFMSDDSLPVYATRTRQELKIAQQRINVSELRYKMINTEHSPVVTAFASGGVKNGYFPDMNQGKLNYVIGVGLKIPVFDAGRTKFNLLQIKTDIENSKQDEELTRRNIVNEVVENEAGVEAALQKITQLQLQLKQAEQAYTLAETSFRSGVITNIELLDNATSLSEAKLMMLKANIDYSVSVLKLKLALGEKL